MPASSVPLVPYSLDQHKAILQGQMERNRRRRSSIPPDPAIQIAAASGGHLTVTEVRDIRRRVQRGREPVYLIADDYDLAVEQVHAVARGMWLGPRERSVA